MEKMKKRRANFDKLKEKRDWLIRPFKGELHVTALLRSNLTQSIVEKMHRQ